MSSNEETSLTVLDNQYLELSVRRDPEVVLAEAQKAATALKKVLDGKVVKVMFGEGSRREQYLEFEDWQTVGKFYGVTAKVVSTTFVSYRVGDREVAGFEAVAEAIVSASGVVISAGQAMCLNDEDKWSSRPKYEWRDLVDSHGKKIWDEHARNGKGAYKSEKIKIGEEAVPLFQLRSMAQTRACAKALRNCLSWVVVMAGYRPTPVEELSGPDHEQNSLPVQEQRTRPRKAGSANAVNVTSITEDQGKELWKVAQGNGFSADDVKAYLKAEYNLDSIKAIQKSDYDAILKAFSAPAETDDFEPAPEREPEPTTTRRRQAPGAPF